MIDLPNGAQWDNSKPYTQQDNEAVEWVQDVIETETPTVDSEEVRGGVALRPLCNEYTKNEIIIKECFVYKNDVNSRGFMALSNFKIEINNG